MFKEELFSFAFIKKSMFYGSYKNMNYRVGKVGDDLEACVFPGPFSYDHTPKEYFVTNTFAFSEEGYEEAKDWLEAQLPTKNWDALAKERAMGDWSLQKSEEKADGE